MYSPAAVHLVARAHEAALRLADRDGLGVAWIAQLRPFQCSARVSSAPERLVYDPAAVQLAAAAQEIPPRPLSGDPAGSGVGWTAHFRPFQCSASVRNTVPALLEYAPAAVQLVAEGQEIPLRLLSGDPAGSGVGWIAQACPFQCSARVSSVPAGLADQPAAVQLAGPAQEIPPRPLSGDPAGSGVGWIAHFRPFQCSASVTVSAARLT